MRDMEEDIWKVVKVERSKLTANGIHRKVGVPSNTFQMNISIYFEYFSSFLKK